MRGARDRALKAALGPRSTAGLLERSGRDVFEREAEDFTISAESVESPGEVGLNGDAESSGRSR